MDKEKLSSFVRIMGICFAIALWVVSIYFSADGFGIVSNGMEWVGYILALGITVMELIFLEEGKNHSLTLYFFGLGAYMYGVGTNVIGLLYAQGHNWGMVAHNPAVLLSPLVVGIFIEVLPEPLLEYCLTGESFLDVVGSILGGIGSGKSRKNYSDFNPSSNRRKHQQSPAGFQLPKFKGKTPDEFPGADDVEDLFGGGEGHQ
jgi:hypothetical protein